MRDKQNTKQSNHTRIYMVRQYAYIHGEGKIYYMNLKQTQDDYRDNLSRWWEEEPFRPRTLDLVAVTVLTDSFWLSLAPHTQLRRTLKPFYIPLDTLHHDTRR